MSQSKVRAALQTALNSIVPAIETGWENVSFTPSSPDVPYQEVHVLFAEPDNPEMGSGYQERGYMQVALNYPKGAGTFQIENRAAVLRSIFFRGASFFYDGVAVTIERTPEASLGDPKDDRHVVLVRIRFFANFF